MIEAYNNAGSNVEGDNTKVKEQAFEGKKKELEKDIETSELYVEYNFDDVDPVVDEAATKKNREDAKKYLEMAYKQAKDGIKAAENLAEQNAKKALATCKKSIKLPDEEKSREENRDLEKAL